MSTSKRPFTRRLVALGGAFALVAAGSALKSAVQPLAVGRLPL
jgi:hypothetical protein